MRALTVVPGLANSARLDHVPEPPASDGAVPVQTLAIGICGTGHEIASGGYGAAHPGGDRLILGHESLGMVVSAPADSGLVEGDLVVGIVRRPDPVPCPACACGEWDMCRNCLYAERGIKCRDDTPPIACGGMWLAALGGSLYYVLILITGALLLAGRRSALWVDAAVLIGTLVWAVSEIGLTSLVSVAKR
jgi:Zn-dependent alcohol dehydrogenase